MSFEKLIRIPQDRIGVLIGKSGKTKREVEKRCSVSLQIDSDSGEIFINGSGNAFKTKKRNDKHTGKG